MHVQELSNVRNLTKMIISRGNFGVRRPMSTTFVDIFKGYNFVVYTKIKLEEEEGQNCRIRARTRSCRSFLPRYRPPGAKDTSDA